MMVRAIPSALAGPEAAPGAECSAATVTPGPADAAQRDSRIMPSPLAPRLKNLPIQWKLQVQVSYDSERASYDSESGDERAAGMARVLKLAREACRLSAAVGLVPARVPAAARSESARADSEKLESLQIIFHME
jgi:hypothetical protein